MTNFKKSLLAVAAFAAMGSAQAQITIGSAVFQYQTLGQTVTDINTHFNGPVASDVGNWINNHIGTRTPGSLLRVTTFVAEGVSINPGDSAWSIFRQTNASGNFTYSLYGNSVGTRDNPASWLQNVSLETLQAQYANLGIPAMLVHFTDRTSASVSQVTPEQANAWRLANSRPLAGVPGVVYRTNIAGGYFFYSAANGAPVSGITINGKNYALTDDASIKLAQEAVKAEEAAQAAEAAKKKDDHVAERTRKTNATVAGAIAINIIVDELVGEELQEYGVAAAASVGGNFELPELNLGVSVDLGKHLGEDFKNVSVHASVGVESGELSVGARKSWKVAEYVTVSAGATIGAQGVRVGPELMICNGSFGIGVAMWGPIPVPQVKIFGYTASVVPHLALANAVVGGSTIAYKAVRAEMKKADAFVKAVEDAVEPAKVEAEVEAVEVDADDLGIED